MEKKNFVVFSILSDKKATASALLSSSGRKKAVRTFKTPGASLFEL